MLASACANMMRLFLLMKLVLQQLAPVIPGRAMWVHCQKENEDGSLPDDLFRDPGDYKRKHLA